MDRGWLRAEGLKTGVLVALLIKVEVHHDQMAFELSPKWEQAQVWVSVSKRLQISSVAFNFQLATSLAAESSMG